MEEKELEAIFTDLDVKDKQLPLYWSYLSDRQRNILGLWQFDPTQKQVADLLRVSTRTVAIEKRRMRQRAVRVRALGFSGMLTRNLDTNTKAAALFGPVVPLHAPALLLARNQLLFTALGKAGVLFVKDLYREPVLEGGVAALEGFGPKLFSQLNANLTDIGLPNLARNNSEAWAVANLCQDKIRLDRFQTGILLYHRWGGYSRKEIAERLEIGELQVPPKERIALKTLTPGRFLN